MALDAIMRKATISPTKRDKEGDISKERSALLSIDIPLDSVSQEEGFAEVIGLMDEGELVKITLESYLRRED